MDNARGGGQVGSPRPTSLALHAAEVDPWCVRVRGGQQGKRTTGRVGGGGGRGRFTRAAEHRSPGGVGSCHRGRLAAESWIRDSQSRSTRTRSHRHHRESTSRSTIDWIKRGVISHLSIQGFVTFCSPY